jgi:thiamine biosynthesis protein ThiS
MEQAQLRITLNGEPRAVPSPSTVADLVASLGLRADQVAIERNKKLVRRAQHAETSLCDGDEVEVVTFFGGG